ncbi:MAG TPA: carboxypeptidase-like regulatory domain-containing protein [Terriglobales bacterium]|nr:carboxypeptidase-like regulatory domain-containing protein [Terriglobales bacterium]
MRRFKIHFAVAIAAMAASMQMTAQDLQPSQQKLATIVGTVLDVNGETVPGATVVLTRLDGNDGRKLVTSENGFFSFQNVQPGIPYHIVISAKDFADWQSSTVTLEPAEYKIVSGIQLRIEAERTTVEVRYDPVQVATEQLRLEEKQRVFGIIPNFYVSYDKNAEALTPKMKFDLALKVASDPVTAAGVLFVAAAKQAGNSPKYGQGWNAYGKRVGVTGADGFIDIMIGGAILPSLLHQDPRYFYQGTGTTGSRIRHAVSSPFISRNDNGSWGPNYSTVGGVLATSAIANLYYPKANRGAGLVFGNFVIGLAERIGASVAQEFIVGKFTKRGGHVD